MSIAINLVLKSTVSILLYLLVTVPVSCWAKNLSVLVVLSDNSAPYLSFANTLNKSLPPQVQSTILDHSEQLPDVPKADLIIAVGMKAMESATAQSSIPVLGAMIPKMSYESLLKQVSLKNDSRSISAIYVDQPWDRWADFLRVTLPEMHRIGLITSLDTYHDFEYLRQVVAQHGDSLVVQTVLVEDELFPRLEWILKNSDILFAIPDSKIYNNSNIRNILLTSYRYRIPLIGLSQAYVNAGALCALFSTPEQLAEQARAMLISFAGTGELREPQYPATFTVSVNQQVARSLEIALPSPEAIQNMMNKAEEARH